MKAKQKASFFFWFETTKGSVCVRQAASDLLIIYSVLPMDRPSKTSTHQKSVTQMKKSQKSDILKKISLNWTITQKFRKTQRAEGEDINDGIDAENVNNRR